MTFESHRLRSSRGPGGCVGRRRRSRRRSQGPREPRRGPEASAAGDVGSMLRSSLVPGGVGRRRSRHRSQGPLDSEPGPLARGRRPQTQPPATSDLWPARAAGPRASAANAAADARARASRAAGPGASATAADSDAAAALGRRPGARARSASRGPGGVGRRQRGIYVTLFTDEQLFTVHRWRHKNG